MKKLILIRHGEATPHEANDRNRPLTSKGRQDTLILGQRIASVEETPPDLVLCSPATRTEQTLEQLTLSIKMGRIEFEERIYTANSTQELLDCLLKRTDELSHTLIVIGHNPTISGTATELSGQAINMSTGCGVALTISAETWQEAFASDGLWKNQKI